MMLVLYAQRVVEQLAAVLDPSVMKSGGIGDVPSLQRAFSWYPRAAFFVAIPLYGGLFVFGASFIRLWVGPDFDESTTVLRILSIAELLSIAASMGGSVLFSLGRLRFNLLCSISEALINLGLSLILVAVLALGTVGAAVGTLVAVIVCRAIVHPLYTTAALGMKYRKYLKESIARGLYVAIVTLLLFTGLVLGLRPSTWVSLIIAVALSVVAYLGFGAFGIFGFRDTGRLINGILPVKWRIYQ
jgi:O-antigen/teichoic acid export membrane protein